MQMGFSAKQRASFSTFPDEEDPRPQFQKYRGEKQHDPLHRRSLSDIEKREMYALYRDPENPASIDYLSQKFKVTHGRCRAILRLKEIHNKWKKQGLLFEQMWLHFGVTVPEQKTTLKKKRRPGHMGVVHDIREAEDTQPINARVEDVYPKDVFVTVRDNEAAEDVVTRLRHEAAMAERRIKTPVPKLHRPTVLNPKFNVCHEKPNRRHKILYSDISAKVNEHKLHANYKVLGHDRVLRDATYDDTKYREQLYHPLPEMGFARRDLPS